MMSQQVTEPTFDHDEQDIDKACGVPEDRAEELHDIVHSWDPEDEGFESVTQLIELVWNEERFSDFERILVTQRLAMMTERQRMQHSPFAMLGGMLDRVE